MADAVGLALGCVGLSLLMSLSSVPTHLGRHMSSLADMLLVGCYVRVCCVLQFHDVVPLCTSVRCTTSAVLVAVSCVREPWQFAIVKDNEWLLPFDM
jgi:hypothetical protein